jgi:hypothetical protein
MLPTRVVLPLDPLEDRLCQFGLCRPRLTVEELQLPVPREDTIIALSMA